MLEPRWKDDGLVGNQVNKLSGLGCGEPSVRLKGGAPGQVILSQTGDGWQLE
jgi:hypothetical protein